MAVVVPDRPTRERVDLPPYPVGWYRVASSADVAPGELVAMTWFGTELLCWRGEEDGEAHVVDPFCAHLGANIGKGGFVSGNDIVCPFHHWRYDPEGRNVEVPYRDRPQRGARLQRWPATEVNGHIMVWNGPAGQEPGWMPPQVPEAADPALVRIEPETSWTIRTHVQEICENTVDIAHLQYVHGVVGFGSVELVESGPMFRATGSVTMKTSRGPVEGAVESELWGLGIDVVRQVGIGSARSIFTITPIDGESVLAKHTFFVPREEGGDGPSRYGQGFMREFSRQIEQDIPIWESKRYREHPKLTTGEGAIIDFRRWATQFYGEE